MTDPDRQPAQSRGWAKLAILATLTATVPLAACNEPRFLIPSATLRGITIPLPPPSFADEVLVNVDIEGNIPIGFDSPDTLVYLYEKGLGRGYFVYTDEMSFTIYDVLVDIDNNCLETWFVDGIDGEESTEVDYKIQLLEDPIACAENPDCTPTDEVGACLCLEKWTVGC